MAKNNVELLKFAESFLGKGGATFRSYCGLGSGQPWCCAFVRYIFSKGGNGNLFYGNKNVTYCPTALTWCRTNLAQIPIYLALPSDIIFFDWQPNNVPDHIGFVRERKSDQEVYTLEGNTNGGIVAKRTRTEKYVIGCFRPHFKPTSFSASKKLTVDGYFGYNSIAVMQRWLGVTQDGILGKGTVKALQKKLGVAQDGSWGVKTSKALQKLVGTTVDGAFGAKSVKAFQTYLNKQVFGTKVTASTPSTSVKTWADKANDWAVKIANDNNYHYVKWSSNSKTHECPVCKKHPKGSTYGWNCIGFAFACWHHGGGLKNKCNCGVIANEVWEKILNASTQAKADEIATKAVGIKVKVVRNGGKAIPLSSLKKGDIIALFKGKEYYHTEYYMGDGKYAESNTTGGIGSKNNIRANLTLSATAKKNLKVAIRPI